MYCKLSISATNPNSLNLYFEYLSQIINKKKSKISAINLPVKIKKIALLKSPHVFKKSKEHFELRKYKRTISVEINEEMLKYFLINKPKNISLSLVSLGK